MMDAPGQTRHQRGHRGYVKGSDDADKGVSMDAGSWAWILVPLVAVVGVIGFVVLGGIGRGLKGDKTGGRSSEAGDASAERDELPKERDTRSDVDARERREG